MASYCQKNEYVPDSFVEEALATIQALRFADELGFRNIELEEDSSTVVRKLKDPIENRSCFSALMKEEEQNWEQFFLHCRYLHVAREGNRVAYIFAKEGLRRDQVTYWMEEVPMEAVISNRQGPSL